jgi:hypothetical protein
MKNPSPAAHFFVFERSSGAGGGQEGEDGHDLLFSLIGREPDPGFALEVALAKLPEAERASWQKLRADVAALVNKGKPPPK